MTAETIHTCSYYCERPECVRRQRDELRDRLEAVLAAAPQQPAAPSGASASAEPAVWVAADTLNSPHPACISSLAYMSQLDRGRGREYVPLYAAPVAAEIERLWVELENWKESFCQAESRAERLAEALEDIRSRSSIDLAMRSDQFELTALLGDIYQIADAALSRRND